MDGHLDEQLVPPQTCILYIRVHARQHCTSALHKRLVHNIGEKVHKRRVHDTTIFGHNTGDVPLGHSKDSRATLVQTELVLKRLVNIKIGAQHLYIAEFLMDSTADCFEYFFCLEPTPSWRRGRVA